MWPYFQKTAETPPKKWKRISWRNSVAHGQYCLTLLSLSKSWVSSKIFKDVFLTLSSIYDRVFLQKQLKAFDRKLFSQNSSILDIWKGSRYNFNFQDDYKWLRQKRHITTFIALTRIFQFEKLLYFQIFLWHKKTCGKIVRFSHRSIVIKSCT